MCEDNIEIFFVVWFLSLILFKIFVKRGFFCCFCILLSLMYWKCFFYRDMDSLCIVFLWEVNIGEFLIGGSYSKLLIVSIEIF